MPRLFRRFVSAVIPLCSFACVRFAFCRGVLPDCFGICLFHLQLSRRALSLHSQLENLRLAFRKRVSQQRKVDPAALWTTFWATLKIGGVLSRVQLFLCGATGMMMLRSMNGWPAPQQSSCTLCHSTSSSPATSFSNMQYRSYRAGTSVGKALQAVNCKGKMNPVALTHISHGDFLTGHPLRLSPLNRAVFEKASVRFKVEVNAVGGGQAGGDGYPQEISSSNEEITPEKAADKNMDSRLDFDFSNAQAVSEEAARKALAILRETTSQLREQAERARSVLATSAQDLPARGKESLSYVAENAPDPVKDIAETALSAHYREDGSVKQGSKIHDFCLGIPYGLLLVVGGLLGFIITGSTVSIRFGVLLGGVILALSLTSLNAWKQGESTLRYIQGQTIIAGAIFFRFMRRYAETKSVFPTGVIAVTSAAMLAFYAYVYISDINPPKEIESGNSY